MDLANHSKVIGVMNQSQASCWFMFLGADINRIDEDQFSVFAPNAKALKEAVDRISEIAMIKVTTLGSHYGAHAKNCFYLKSL